MNPNQPPGGFPGMPGFPMMPMMAPGGAPMDPMQLQRQMMQMQQQFQQMMQMQQALAQQQQQHQQQQGGHSQSAPAAVPAPFPMPMPMFPMGMMNPALMNPAMMNPAMMQMAMPVAAPPAAAAPAPAAAVSKPGGTPAPQFSPAPAAPAVPTAVASPAPVPPPAGVPVSAPLSMSPMPLMGGFPGMPIGMLPGVRPPENPGFAWHVAQSTAQPAQAAQPQQPAQQKPDVFGDLSNPNLALRKERFTIEQPKTKSVPPPSAGVRAEDDEEEEFADFASAEAQKTDEIRFDEPSATSPTAGANAPQSSNELSFDPPANVQSPIPLEPLPKPDLSADALMSKAFDLFQHKQSAPLVQQASMSQIASHSHTPSKAQSHSAQPQKGRRDMPRDLDDLLSDLVGPGTSASKPVELPGLGPAPAQAQPAAFEEDEDFGDFASTQAGQPTQAQVHPPTQSQAEVEDDDEDFGDFSSTAAQQAAAASHATVAAPQQSAAVEDDDEGFGDFNSTAATSAPMPTSMAITSSFAPTSSFNVPTSSFGVPTSSFPMPTSSFPAPASSFSPPPAAGITSSFGVPTSSFTMPTSSFVPPTTSFVPPTSAAVIVNNEADDEEEEEEEFADFASSPPAQSQPQAPSQSLDPFGDLGAEAGEVQIAGLAPEIPKPPAAATVEEEEEFADFSSAPPAGQAAAAHSTAPAAATVEDEDEEEEFADFSSAPPTAEVKQAQPSIADEENEDFADFSSAEKAPEAVAELPAEPEKPKGESDLIGDWAAPLSSSSAKKKSNPFAAAPDSAPAPEPIAQAPLQPSPQPSFDDVFGALLDSDASASAPPALPDLMPGLPLTAAPKPKARGSVSQALESVTGGKTTMPLAAMPAAIGSPIASFGAAGDEEDDFGTFASSAEPANTTQATGPPSLEASPAPAFSLSAAAESLALPLPLTPVPGRVPRSASVAARPVEEDQLPDGEDPYPRLVRQERFAEAKLCAAYRNSATELSALQARYKSLLAAAEDDDDEEKLAAAMKLQKQIKALKALKPDETWAKDLTPEQQQAAPASWVQIQKTLTAVDEEWEGLFSSIYPQQFSAVAEEKGIDAAIEQQQEANAFMRDILAMGVDFPSVTQQFNKTLAYINQQLSTGRKFMDETSHLDLYDPTKEAEFATLLSAPSSSCITFLTGLSRLYQIVLKMEFASALYELSTEPEVFATAHSSWLDIMKYAHSSPLSSFLSSWLSSNSIDVDAERVRMDEENSAGVLAQNRGRHRCPVCMTNQAKSGIHPTCAALQSQIS